MVCMNCFNPVKHPGDVAVYERGVEGLKCSLLPIINSIKLNGYTGEATLLLRLHFQ